MDISDEQPPGKTERPVASALDTSPSALAQRVVDLEARLELYEDRMARVESRSQHSPRQYESHSPTVAQSANPAARDDGPRLEQTSGPGTESTPFSMDGVNLGPPTITLRALQGGDEHYGEERGASSGHMTSERSVRNDRTGSASLAVLDDMEIKSMVAIYFEHCHPMAPLLDTSLYNELDAVRRDRPALLLALCCVGARFWSDSSDSVRGPHPKLPVLTAMLDKAISRLLLRPTMTDVHLDSVRILLLYVQWMPLDVEVRADDHRATQKRHRTRYSDISAWSCLGLALRYSTVLGLETAAVAPFIASEADVRTEDMSRLRVLQNLVTCDWNLMLSSGLPMSSDPGPVADVGHAFAGQVAAQSPGDIRVTALVELVVLIRTATNASPDPSGRQLGMFHLRKLNAEMDEWERKWIPQLCHTDYQHSSLPFTSLRWCRLALNSAQLTPLLSPTRRPDTLSAPLTLPVLQSLEICLSAALHILLSLSEVGTELLQQHAATQTLYQPSGPLKVAITATIRFGYAVDSAWISHTFAIAFLILCYIRGAVDDDLNICFLNPADTLRIRAPVHPRPGSLLGRVSKLTLDIFHTVCASFTCHPAQDFLPAVENAVGLVLRDSNEAIGMDETADQDLFDVMHETGMDWPGFFDGADLSWQESYSFQT
ncbi:hypothetical protein LTR97_006959 [Elasticomyces elasticus]|uniref:Transcription factor domain-containing protein n=1 Tax=Elasticomyces elasticus TaxID=574655 RepID=A0AAN7ZTL2_9PEZI|nr:hypothetical protein LTR97_006959 [Elasticomyces elasticus]